MADTVFIGDDFTGASDTLATLAERGARARLFLDAPEESETAGLDAVGIATDLRARSPEEATLRLNLLAQAMHGLAPRYIHYKVCSTFDSAPHVGSIGAAVLALEAAFAPSRTIVLGGQPSLGRYCVFGTLFARAPDGKTYRIDRHPIMSRHPVTPMDEANLRIHLRRQGLDKIDLISRSQLQSASNEVAETIRLSGRVLIDGLDLTDMERIGEILRRIDTEAAPLLLIGASSVAEALYPPSDATPLQSATKRADGPRLAVAGSRSSATAAQVAAATSYKCLPLHRDHLEAGQSRFAKSCAELLASGRNVLIHLRPDLDYGLASAALSERLAALTATIVQLQQVAAIAVAGGDTSSAVVKRLGFRSLSFVERAGAGVAVCRGDAAGCDVDGTLLLLKGGQVGDVGMLERFATDK